MSYNRSIADGVSIIGHGRAVLNMNEENVNISENENEENEFVKRDYPGEISDILSSGLSDEEIRDKLDDYHDNDIASALEELTSDDRRRSYRILGLDRSADIFTYFDNVAVYFNELDNDLAARIITEMDADEATEVLDELTDERRREIGLLLDDETKREIRLIDSYSDECVGSRMSTNFVTVKRTMTVKQAMSSLIRQAAENDNITTIYAVDDKGKFCGAIELRDLIVTRAGVPLDDIIATSYPFLYAGEEIEECIEDIKDYSEDSIPVLNSDNKIIGVITATEMVDVVDTQMGEDYARLAGLSEESDVNETVFAGVRKRMPWLIILLGLGLIVSTVVGAFERVISGLTIIVSFQSIVLDMAGNVGTQSLGVTLRTLIAEDEMTVKEKAAIVFKEARIGLMNGLVLGILSTIVIGAYICLVKEIAVKQAYLIAGCVGMSLVVAMFVSSAVGTAVPIILKALKFDPAVASGPLITTCNDLVAVTIYYGLAWIFLINIFNMAQL